MDRTIKLVARSASRSAGGGTAVTGVRGDRLAPLVLAREPAPGERTPHEHADPVALGDREDVTLGLPGEDRVGSLLADDPGQAPALADPVGLDQFPGRIRGGADVADLALVHEVVERGEGLLDVGQRV